MMKIDRWTIMFVPVALTLMASFPAKASSEQTSQVRQVAEHKRLEASICPDSMNRLAVANDRITQLFGDEGTFESQNDEGTGQVFLKPTAENGSKSLSLTLITEQGLTQDLTLKPTAKSATTLILTRDLSDQSPGKQKGWEPTVPGVRNRTAPGIRETASDLSFGKALSFQGQVLNVLKQAIAGQLPAQEVGFLDKFTISNNASVRENPLPEACTLTLSQSWQAGTYTVQAFQVENLTETPLELQEKDFYQPGDLALSFQKRVLPIGGKTTLYVVFPKTQASLEMDMEATP